MIVGITGHRPDKVGGYGPSALQDKIRAAIDLRLSWLCPKLLLSGMALGVDQWAVECAIASGIPFVACVPFEGQEGMWPTESQQHYHELLKQAARIVIVSPGGFSASKMQVRNQYIVDNCDAMIGVWNHTSGGTANCLRYAIRKDKAIWLIDPRDYDGSKPHDSGVDQRAPIQTE